MQTESSTTRLNTNRPNATPRTTIARFALGQTYITPGAQEALQIAGQTELEFLRRHMSGDWTEMSGEDQRQNRIALLTGKRVLGAYLTCKRQVLWIVTEGDRSSTTVMLPDE
jgi:hypothetical protein